MALDVEDRRNMRIQNDSPKMSSNGVFHRDSREVQSDCFQIRRTIMYRGRTLMAALVGLAGVALFARGIARRLPPGILPVIGLG